MTRHDKVPSAVTKLLTEARSQRYMNEHKTWTERQSVKVTSVSFKRGATINVGDFESVRLEVSGTAEIEDDESESEAFNSLRRFIDEHLHEEVVKVRGRMRKRAEREAG